MLFGFGELFFALYYIVFIWLWTGWRKFVSVPLLLIAAATSTPFSWIWGLVLLGLFFALPTFGVWLGERLDGRFVRRAAQRTGVNLDLAQATDQPIPKQIKRLNGHSLGGFGIYDANEKKNIRALRRHADNMVQNVSDRNGQPLGVPMGREEFGAAMQRAVSQHDAALDLMPHLQQQAISRLLDPENNGTPDLAGFPTRWMGTENGAAANVLTAEQMKQLNEYSSVCRAVLAEDHPSGTAVKLQPILEMGVIGAGLVGWLIATFTGHPAIGAVAVGAPLLVTLGQYIAARLMNSPGFVRAVMEHEVPESIGSIMNRTLGTTVSGRIVKNVIDEARNTPESLRTIATQEIPGYWRAARSALRDLRSNRK